MNQQRDRSCLVLVPILLVYVVLASWYSLTIPLGEAPDEVPHFSYIRYLVQNQRLPTTTEEHEAFQPPLYYALGAATSFLIKDEPGTPFAVRANAHFDVHDARAPKNLLLHTADEAWPFRGWALAWHLVRLLSVMLGAATVWAIYHLGRVVFPREPAVGLAMAALTAFTPQFLFMTAIVNNDNAAATFSALVLWQVAALLQDRERGRFWRRSALLGLLLGLGLLSKANLIALLPIVALAIVVASARNKQSEAKERVPQAVVGLLLAFSLAALLSGWYFARNWVLHGDPMGWSFLLEVNARREGPLSLEVLAWLFRGLFRSFWLGWIGIQFDEPIYWAIGAACLVGVAGFFFWLFRRWRMLEGGFRWTLVLLGLHAAITLGSLLQWTATVLGTDQARLIYPLLPTIMLVLVSGWAWWARGQARNWVLGALVAGMLLLAILTPLRYIGPVHDPAPVATDTELSAAVSLDIQWNNIRLLGYRLENDRVSPGEKLVLLLYWETTVIADQDLMALIQLVDVEGKFLMYTDGSPSAGRDTTDRWSPGVPLSSQHLLPIPEYSQPGTYRLTISLHPFGEAAWLPATGPGGVPGGDHLVLPEEITITTP